MDVFNEAFNFETEESNLLTENNDVVNEYPN